MSDTVYWILEMKMEPEKAEDFNAVMADLVAATQLEEGTIAYEWHFDDEGTVCHIYERFRDSDAADLHLEMFGEIFADRFLAAGSPTKLTIYGDPKADVVETLSGFSPRILKMRAGFSRFG